MSNKKPPLGVMPNDIWKAHRAIALVEAMERYLPLLNAGDTEDNDAARDLIDGWAREIIALNLPRAMPF